MPIAYCLLPVAYCLFPRPCGVRWAANDRPYRRACSLLPQKCLAQAVSSRVGTSQAAV